MRPTTFLALVGLTATLLTASALAPAAAEAQRTPTKRAPRRAPQAQAADGQHEGQAEGPAAPAPTIADLDEIVPRLRSTNPDEVREAIDLLSVIDRREVIPPLAELLRSGQPDAITDRALEALRGLADPASIDVLTEFTRHRRAGARRRAYAALAAIEDRRVATVLEQGLRDSDRSVRAACALALGTIGARGSLDTLFVAFERGVVEAAVAIGKLGNDGSVERFTGHLGQQPLSVMLSGYEQYLRRNDISDQTKIAIVNRLGEVSGRAVREFLTQYLATMPAARAARPPRRGQEAAPERRSLRDVVTDTIRRIPVEGDTRRTAPVSGETTPPSTPASPAAAGGSQ